ncbi:MAG: riboflavin synthase [Gammaproteobacteria bacterium]|nr:riboflavin synthase [Gammaproteobacteria bacterium]MDH3374707.1 riboflavin synthase [Gammaproteobacteria bacterium]MDH3554043.1 riboflavin synthase [Gammaproteobacteria bacterium]
MFTGIIKAIGTISAIERRGGDVRLSVKSNDMPFSEYAVGESIAVSGVCLTAVALHDDSFETDVSVETLDVTALGRLGVGDKVNLEPSLSLGDRLGGHLVSGHVDCVGSISKREADARSTRLTIAIPLEFARYVAKKGSITVDGVSLTINEVSGNGFEVNIIPHTAEATIIGGYVVGTRVNIEVDVLARYIERLLANDGGGLSKDFLRDHGYV